MMSWLRTVLRHPPCRTLPPTVVSAAVHEINNALAALSADHTNIADLVAELPPEHGSAELTEALTRCRRQVERCRRAAHQLALAERMNE